MLDPASVSVKKLHQLLGAHVIDDDQTRFCVWAPTHQRVWLDLVETGRRLEMERRDQGYHTLTVDGVTAGHLYFFLFGEEAEQERRGRPDPASRFQPRGVHGPSMVVATDHPWGDQSWKGVPRESLVIYELHVGTLTREGTFLSAIERLDELVDLGVTAIELMPVADAAGRWNWGYDGVNLFAPNRNYGTPSDFRSLVDAAHARGLSVFLDVVYNHLGPEGNYLAECGPYLSARHGTPWGDAPNFDDPQYGIQLRRFVIANAIHWFDHYHIDGLRVDAIHCMRDESDRHVVAEMAEAVRDWSMDRGREVMLIAESNVYDSEMLDPPAAGGIGFDAEWCDDFLHSVFAVAKPGEHLCHRAYESGTDLEQTLRVGYVYEGSLREQRGRTVAHSRVDTSGLVYSIQHHDFIGNHPAGKRLHQVTCVDFQRASATLLLLCPAIPMLFMGEEFACEHPFQFFVDFQDESLRNAVVEGRRREYPQHDWRAATLPIDEQAFFDSKIGPVERGNSAMRLWYKRLLKQRKLWLEQGLLTDRGLLSDTGLVVHCEVESGLFCLQYRSATEKATVAVQLSADSGPDPASQRVRWLAEQDVGDLLLDSRSVPTGPDELAGNHAKVFLSRNAG